jgi:hypothetical protein
MACLDRYGRALYPGRHQDDQSGDEPVAAHRDQSFMPLCDVHRVVTFRLTSARRVISVEPRLAFAALGVMARCSALARRFRSAALRYE